MSDAGNRDRYLMVHAYCDGELDPVNAREIERWIAEDPALAAERDRIMALRRALHDKLPPQPLPQGLRGRIERAIGLRRRSTAQTWNAIAASLAALVVLAAVAGWYLLGRGDNSGLIEELTASHARALIVAHVTDVESSDQHTIKPWFATRTAQAPAVVELAADGFPLLGGRLDVIAKIPVPTLVYGHRQHVISLTQMPASASAGVASGARSFHGLHVIGWTDRDTSYFATSDIAMPDLQEFVQKYKDQARKDAR